MPSVLSRPVTRGRFVMHTVGPRYNVKYRTAAESALFNSYREAMQALLCVMCP